MPFEVFSRKTAARSSEPFVTIQKRGTFSLNAGAAQLLCGDDKRDPEGLPVDLLYDRDERMVGLRRSDRTDGVYVLRKQPNSESYLLAGKAFTQHYGIQTETSKRFRVTILEEGILAFKLDDENAVEVARSDSASERPF